MKKIYIVAAITLLLALQAKAQKLRVSADSVNYGTLFKFVSSAVNITVFNDAAYDMQGIVLKTTNKDFALSDTLINLPANSSKNIKITFTPRHNITYNADFLVISKSPFGTVRTQLKGTGVYNGTFYTATQDKWEGDLLTALKNRTTQGHITNIGYTGARDQMYAFVDIVNDSITCVYIGRKAKFNTRAGAVTNDFTAEHTFPRSKYNSADPMFSDIHHLFPADGPANTRRSDDPYGIVTSPVWMVGGSLSDNQKFEPRNQHKGTGARALFYFVTRYQDYTNFFDPQEDLMRQWAVQYPPSSWDSLRNEKTFIVQGNRNPFIDHPEFLERISNFVGAAPAATKTFTSTYTQPVNMGYVPIKDTILHGISIVNTGNAAIDFSLTAINAKPQPNVTTQEGLFTLQPRQTRYLSFRFIAKTTGTNFTDSFSLQAVGGANTIIAFTANVSGLSAKETVRKNITLYPNPAQNTAQLFADEQLNYPCNIDFYTHTGQKVYSTVLNQSFTELNLSTLPAGCYFVQVNDGNLSSVTKLIKY